MSNPLVSGIPRFDWTAAERRHNGAHAPDPHPTFSHTPRGCVTTLCFLAPSAYDADPICDHRTVHAKRGLV